MRAPPGHSPRVCPRAGNRRLVVVDIGVQGDESRAVRDGRRMRPLCAARPLNTHPFRPACAACRSAQPITRRDTRRDTRRISRSQLPVGSPARRAILWPTGPPPSLHAFFLSTAVKASPPGVSSPHNSVLAYYVVHVTVACYSWLPRADWAALSQYGSAAAIAAAPTARTWQLLALPRYDRE